jgi:superfamily II DNA or RNA helicase
MPPRRARPSASRWVEPDWIDLDELDDELDEVLGPQGWPGASWAPSTLAPSRPPGRPPGPGNWEARLAQVAAGLRGGPAPWPAGREIEYVVPAAEIVVEGRIALDVACRSRLRSGEGRRLTSFRLSWDLIDALPDPVDRRILATVAGGGGYYASYVGTPDGHRGFTRFYLPPPLVQDLLPLVIGTGRASLRTGPLPAAALRPLRWDDGPPWRFRLEARRLPGEGHYEVAGALVRDAERVELAAPVLLLDAGLVFFADTAARLDHGGAFAWVTHLRRAGPLRVPARHAVRFVEALARLPALPPHAFPPDLAAESARPVPRPRLAVRRGPRDWPPDLLEATLAFDYDGARVEADQAGAGLYDPARRRLVARDLHRERAARERLREAGVRERPDASLAGPARRLALPARALPRVARVLLAEGWEVEGEAGLYRQPGAFRLAVTTGVDWFDLQGAVEFGEEVVPLPALLAALRRGESAVRLGDGTFGLLPEEWLARYGLLAGLGTPEGDRLRFRRAQVGFLDALVAAQPEVAVDALFVQARDELRRFEGVAPADPPGSFAGRLRGYQRDGLGWLHFLRRFGFGGCLADDMGLGKTVMVLALLEARRVQGATKPSLVVVPRSLVFNWRQEAARFAPALTVLDHTGAGRRVEGEHFARHAVVLTTYGTLRRDALRFKDVEFDYVVLDEAQAIKNPGTDAAKAARLLRGDHRLALSGTPVENHLGELWSLFEFLNPGMLGAAGLLGLDGAAGRSPDEATRGLLARALRPFILRRTKGQVAPELPPRTEQTVYCALEPAQRRLYDELREHYRRILLGRVDALGLGRSKLVVLEALLRLRQAACHPGLIDRGRADEPAGKLDVLLPRLRELHAEGHKALVFSQFTSFLRIVRERLDREGLRYEYLDGATRDRAARVAHFQADPGIRVFLVSLRAGGLGLNLTAAEHVFLLDPWWNPAVEAQAIDRAHRIGQARHVLAFRLIAHDTVEEKILQLQGDKRELAAAIVTEQNSLIRTLTREDLELLLS